MDHGKIYDFTSWVFGHPGNSETRNPIAEVAEAGNSTLMFPSWHEMVRWNSNKVGLEGGYIKLGDVIDFYQLPEELFTEELASAIGIDLSINESDNVGVNGTEPHGATMVCGSPFETANDPTLGGSQGTGAFDASTRHRQTTYEALRYQRNVVWMKAILEDPGQLRQRVAWALSQILVISPTGIDGGTFLTEAFLAFYDIFVRHAFGNYKNVLKEVAYSPMMADMLTYLDQKSTAAVWQEEGIISFADENFAREVLQLFTTGLFILNDDGTKLAESKGVYTNDDIEEYARAWTGFVRQSVRGNLEESYGNRIDPMKIAVAFRDRYPKMGLDRKYVGDGYPLCSDLPPRHFLANGAKYMLLGSEPIPELHEDPLSWAKNSTARLSLSTSSDLFAELCSLGENGECVYRNIAVLGDGISCFGVECEVDTVRIVQVKDMFYEYIRPACVHQAFFKNAQTMARKLDGTLICGDPRVEIASTACCGDNMSWTEVYWGEHTKYATSQNRCSGALCTQEDVLPSCDENPQCDNNGFYWTAASCGLQIKVNDKGKVAIVHTSAGGWAEAMDPLVRQNSQTFFRVDWEGDYPVGDSDCGSSASCAVNDEGLCICDVYVKEVQVFFGSTLPSRDDIFRQLHIGSIPMNEPDVNGDVRVYGANANGSFSISTVFEFVDDFGVQHRRINMRSTVAVEGTSFAFRNPPHFVGLAAGDVRDAHYETEAVLDQYLYHPNTAPFLAFRFAQRFGTSNPSPRYVEAIARAFQSGTYIYQEHIFGTGEYGDLAATVAATLLDDEVRNVILDADPTHGAFKEPLIKVTSLLRSLAFKLHPHSPWADFSPVAGDAIGQMAHYAPSVFSFFLPEYQPAGRISQSSLVAPEAQILTEPRIVDSFNGIFSLIKYGLTPCYGGFAEQERRYYCQFIEMGQVEHSLGALTYRPSPEKTPKEVVDELATLLTSGRMSVESRRMIERILEEGDDVALMKAQMMATATPEFHVTNLVRQHTEARSAQPLSSPSSHRYKALINIQLPGGVDSYNLLVPHTCSPTNSNGLNLRDQYNNERSSIAFTDDERTRIIDVTNQPCEQFAVHPDMSIVETLYNDGSLAFFANIGQVDVPVTKDDYYASTRTELFAHNTMQLISQSIDPWDAAAGTGILGRFSDVLSGKGYNVQPITVAESTIATAGTPGEDSVDPLIVSARGLSEFAPRPETETFDIKDFLPFFNNVTHIHSSVYGETWSDRLNSAMGNAKELWGALENVTLTQSYPADEDSYGLEIRTLMSLMMTHEDRGVDRDLFWLSLGEWDHHENLKPNLSSEFQRLNQALTLLVQELRAQDLYDEVVVVITSDFGRTLTANSGTGSDHAWGGNLFAFGGSVKGNQIFGEYPADITGQGALNVGRGRLIPTLSWESMFNGVAEWLGVETSEELDYCMPNRLNTGTTLFSKSELFHPESQESRRLRGTGPDNE